MPSLARKSALGCEGRVPAPPAGGGLERGPGGSDVGRVQAEAPVLAMGCDGSPPTTIIGERNARTPAFDGDSAPNGSSGLGTVGLGGGASLRETGDSEVAAAGDEIAGRGRVGMSSSRSIGTSTVPGSAAAALSESWGSSIVMGREPGASGVRRAPLSFRSE